MWWGKGNVENCETENLTCIWKQQMSVMSLKNDDTIQVVGKMQDLVLIYFAQDVEVESEQRG